MKFHIPENAKLVTILPPAADAAGRTGAFISMKNANRCFLIAFINQGNAATVALTVNQATNVSGAGAKAVANTQIWADLDCVTSDALVRQTDAAGVYTTDAGVKQKIVVFQIDDSALDTNNGFTSLNLSTGASNAANITAAYAICTGERYEQVTPPSAIVN